MNSENTYVEVVDAPILKLAFADGVNALGIVEGVPELRDDEEFRASDEAFVYGTRDTEANFEFVAVVWD